MSKFAFIFPGQGSQAVGMGLDLYNSSSDAKSIYDRIDTILGRKISSICFNGPDEDLVKTVNSQPAILATSIACLEAFKAIVDVQPVYCAGHSLGEYAALYCAGVMNLDDTIKAIQKRAELMNDAALKLPGSMLAIIGCDFDLIKNSIEEIRNKKAGILQIANYNTPAQIVVTGEENLIEDLSDLIKAKGARKIVKLAVSGGFHSELMKNAGLEFKEYIENFSFNSAKFPVFTNVDGIAEIDANNFKDKLPKQIYSSVFWYQSINQMIDKGVDTFIEFGHGRVLAGLNKKINPNIKTFNISDYESILAFKNELELI